MGLSLPIPKIGDSGQKSLQVLRVVLCSPFSSCLILSWAMLCCAVLSCLVLRWSCLVLSSVAAVVLSYPVCQRLVSCCDVLCLCCAVLYYVLCCLVSSWLTLSSIFLRRVVLRCLEAFCLVFSSAVSISSLS